jgi:hypothetical protein
MAVRLVNAGGAEVRVSRPDQKAPGHAGIARADLTRQVRLVAELDRLDLPP